MEKRGVGRPTKYNDEMQAQADDYVYRLEELGHVVPSRVGLCCFLGISKPTSFEWEREYPAFSTTLRNVETLQEHLTLNGGLSNKLNSTIVKLVLANHGYSDRVAQDHTSSDGSMGKVEKVEISIVGQDASDTGD